MGACDQKTTEGILDFFFDQGGMIMFPGPGTADNLGASPPPPPPPPRPPFFPRANPPLTRHLASASTTDS